MTINLLWTGGWDSTFRLLQAVVVERRAAQPHYVLDHRRRSLRCELRAMAAIKDEIGMRFPEARARVLPTRLYERCEIPPNDAITASHKSLLRQSYLGGQYDWLARLAAARRIPRLELAIHRDDRAHAFIRELVTRDGEGCFVLAPGTDGDAATLFKDFVFPILDSTKLEMAAIAREQGFAACLELTWFCDNPDRHLRPCGGCGPCRYAIDEGLARRVPSSNRVMAQIRRVFRGASRRLRDLASRH